MDKLRIIRELLKDEATVELVEEFSKHKCILTELDSDYSLEILNVPKNSIIIKGDCFKSPDYFFNGSKMECKRADYIIIVEEPKPLILIIELKRSGNSSTTKEIVAQLKGASCLLTYCERVISEFWGEENIFDEYEKRYYISYSISISKKMTYEKQQGIDNKSPDKARKFQGKTIQYRKLIS